MLTCDGVRLGYKARETSTDGVALLTGLTSGAGPTGTWLAGIWSLHTSLAPADLAVVTVRVDHTLRATASDGVWLGDEAGQTPTDGVALGVGGAGGPGTTGAGLAGVQDCTPDLWTGVGAEAWRTLAGGSALLGDTHGVLPTRVGVTGVGHHTALPGGWVGHQALRTLAGGFSLLGNTHGARPTGVGVAGVAPWCGLVGRQGRRGWGRVSGLAQASVGAAVEAAEAPVWTVQVSHAH